MNELNKLFNLNPMEENTGELIVPENLNANKELDKEDDYQLARQTMRTVLMTGGSTLTDLLELSKNSEHPRTYEVAGQFMKTLSDVSKDLLGLQKQVKELDTEESVNKINTQNNVVFAGSTNELMKFLNGNKNDIIDQ